MHQLIELLAVISSAIYGVLLARRHQFDFVGVFSLAFIVSFGGGTLRDLFLDRHPLFWIQHHHYPLIVFVIALVTSLLPRIPKRTTSILQVPDALGLGFFTVAGTSASIDMGTSSFIAALMGVVTGTFGGVIGDIICNRVPSLFRPAPLFATCSFAGAWTYILLSAWPETKLYAAPVAIACVVVFRLSSIRYNWILRPLEYDFPGSEEQNDVEHSDDEKTNHDKTNDEYH